MKKTNSFLMAIVSLCAVAMISPAGCSKDEDNGETDDPNGAGGAKTTIAVVESGTGGACSWTLTGAPGSYTLTIGGAGAMGNYGNGGAPWWKVYDSIATIVIGDGVTTISNYAFAIRCFCRDL
jgi:hypothetical protein